MADSFKKWDKVIRVKPTEKPIESKNYGEVGKEYTVETDQRGTSLKLFDLPFRADATKFILSHNKTIKLEKILYGKD